MTDISFMTKEEALRKIAELTTEAHSLIIQAEGIANAHDLSFYFDVAYGMGGSYSGKDGEWYPSSQNC